MKSNDKKMTLLIDKYKLKNRNEVIEFVKVNPEGLGVEMLSRISELVNNFRIDTAAYYTDDIIAENLVKSLPKIHKDEIHILEPSVGVGNFLQPIINKFSYCKKLHIHVNDVDKVSLELLKSINHYRDIPGNVEITYHNYDFLHDNPILDSIRFDYVIGNPPFIKLKKRECTICYLNSINKFQSNNTSALFLNKALLISDYVALILPKYFLNSSDFEFTRNNTSKYSVEKIIDFGEKGFKGVLIETIAVLVNTLKKPNMTVSYSLTKNIENTQKQDQLVSEKFNCWLLYRNHFFDELSSKMIFSVFKAYRDRQLTNSILRDSGEIRVLRSRNISKDGSRIIDLDEYDRYISVDNLEKLSIRNFYARDDVYLTPNMTYYPRVIKKPKYTLVNGSVAILENISGMVISDNHLKFLSSTDFAEFYAIARNYSTRSLNIDSNSVVFFGLIDSDYNGIRNINDWREK